MLNSPLKILSSVLATGLWLAAAAAHAQDAASPSPLPPDRRGVITFVNENDLYAFDNNDRHYTNGVRLGWMSADDDVAEWAKELGDNLPFLDPTARRRVGVSLGHNLYTPENKATTELNPRDRPYAAWLYTGFALQSESPTRLDTIEIDIGVVGPAALGKPIQNNYHRLIGANGAHGWSHQIKNEPGLAVVFERKWRQIFEMPVGGLGVDAIPHISGSVGNVFTYGGAGLMVRFGEDLTSDFGPPRIRPALPGSQSFRPRDAFGWYLFAGAEGRYVVRDIFLDGNTFTDSHSVDKKPLVADFQMGLALLFERVRLSYTQVIRTREFEGQARPDMFGSISLSARF